MTVIQENETAQYGMKYQSHNPKRVSLCSQRDWIGWLYWLKEHNGSSKLGMHREPRKEPKGIYESETVFQSLKSLCNNNNNCYYYGFSLSSS